MPQGQVFKMQKTPSHRSLSRIQIAINKNTIAKKIQDSTSPTKDLLQSCDCSKLTSLIKQKRLTDLIEYLEKAGYTGDTAIVLLAKLQTFGGAV